jgi:hypothetical protein
MCMSMSWVKDTGYRRQLPHSEDPLNWKKGETSGCISNTGLVFLATCTIKYFLLALLPHSTFYSSAKIHIADTHSRCTVQSTKVNKYRVARENTIVRTVKSCARVRPQPTFVAILIRIQTSPSSFLILFVPLACQKMGMQHKSGHDNDHPYTA